MTLDEPVDGDHTEQWLATLPADRVASYRKTAVVVAAVSKEPVAGVLDAVVSTARNYGRAT